MQRRKLSVLVIALIASALGVGYVTRWLPSPQSQMIESFYKDYLDRNMKQTALPFSRSFNALLERNHQICNENAGTDVCGWGADGDVYLDSQEVDPQLTFANSQFEINDLGPGVVQVSFNVYPSDKKNRENYRREIQYKVIDENGQWVVDDMFSHGESARAWILREIELYLNKKAND